LNDGTHSFSIRTVDCAGKQPPVKGKSNNSQADELQIQITHPERFMTQMEDGFLTFNVQLTLELKPLGDATTAQFDAFTDTYGVNQLFVGWKNSAEILNQLQIMNGNDTGTKPTNFQDNECTKEGFAFQTLRPVESKMSRYDHFGNMF
jgi:hypothetical protein